MSEAVTHDLKVGDELAFYRPWGGWDFYKITRFTPSGRIVCGPYTLNPDLRVRGGTRYTPYAGRVPTEELRNEIETERKRRENINLLRDASFSKFSDDVLAKLASIVRKNTVKPETSEA